MRRNANLANLQITSIEGLEDLHFHSCLVHDNFTEPDIEMLIIENDRVIVFPNTWSSTNSYDCLIMGFGCHDTTRGKSYSPSQIIYVSNTCNHMMDTSDTNRGLSN